MKALKMIFYIILGVVAVGLLVFSGVFLWQALPRKEEPPEVVDGQWIFEEETAPTEETTQPEMQPKPEETLPEEPAEVEPEPEEAEPAPEGETPRTLAEGYLQKMTLEEKIWQLFITTPEDLTGVTTATRAGDATRAALETYPVGGICYFADNLEDAQQTREMLANTQSYAKTGLFLCVDEEGGLVSRVGANEAMGVTKLEPAANYGAAGDVSAVFQSGKQLGAELAELGFNLDFAPVADVAGDTQSSEIGNRSYSSDPEVAAAMVGAMVSGLQKGGVLACLKHFPGHGSVQTDSHAGTAVSTRTLEELRACDWLPFQSGIEEGAVFVMLSHQSNANLSSLPASLSPEVVSYLREELGYAGIILTDSHQMGAITDNYTSGEAAVLALEAGVDMILMPNDLQAAFDGVQAAVAAGTITEERINESVLRILTVKYARGILS